MTTCQILGHPQCSNGTCPQCRLGRQLSRGDLLTISVVEAARSLMAAELTLERLVARSKDPEKWDNAAAIKGECWQILRDVLAAERASRGAR